MSDPRELEPLLVPAPRRIERRAGHVPATPPLRVPGGDLAPEAYRLRIGTEGDDIWLQAGSDAGANRALATLMQLRTQYGEVLPRLEIEDRPAIERRGWMLDVSRDRVPTTAHLGALVDDLAGLKLNEFELYTEHTFAYARHEEVWRHASPITADELRGLDALARTRAVALIGNQNCFGHFERWLRLPRYAELAETCGRFEFEGIELQGPFSLCPTDPRSLELVRELLDELLPLLSSGAVNVGCDETQDVGQGRSRAEVEARGAFSVYAEHLGGVAESAARRGCEPRFWADIALREPERVGELHEALVPIAWGYEPDHPFDVQAAALSASGRPFHLACGSSAWRSFLGRTTERRGNLDACLRAAQAHRARGVLLCEWGDVGHRQVPAIGRLALAEFAARSWNPDARVDPRAVSLHLFGDRGLTLADWIAALGDLDRPLREVAGVPDDRGRPTPLRNAGACFEALHPSGFPFALPDDAGPWRETLEGLAQHRATRPACDDALAAQLEHACDQAELALLVALHARSCATDADVERLRALRGQVRDEHRRLWLEDSREGGLDDSLGTWAAANDA